MTANFGLSKRWHGAGLITCAWRDGPVRHDANRGAGADRACRWISPWLATTLKAVPHVGGRFLAQELAGRTRRGKWASHHESDPHAAGQPKVDIVWAAWKQQRLLKMWWMIVRREVSEMLINSLTSHVKWTLARVALTLKNSCRGKSTPTSREKVIMKTDNSQT